ncbi:DUF3993 domain-containing protein [Bacillus litorisediminis]|uniref:DUF3993 domain-containing protein n=1 Tax=Bacillus litorisediminis TaxID=2922713 RepID=UPI001FAE363E|nr:DUF3993 domain-containing protein [Bacillus litorisediminis]
MKKKIAVAIIAVCMCFISVEAGAEARLSRGQAITLVQDTFSAQVSLSEKPRTIEEVIAILDPYATSEFRQSFLEANLVNVDGKYQTFGSDFAPFYIPFFAFNQDTKFALADKKAYVYEMFAANSDGPVKYKEGFRGVELQLTEDGWKVHNILSPEEMLPVIEKIGNYMQDSSKWNLPSMHLAIQTPAVIPSVYFVPFFYSSLVLSHLSIGFL